jgi:hypothetical protein
MSDAERRDEIEVEVHGRRPAATDEPAKDEDEESEVEAHVVRFPNVRMD